MIRCHCHGDYRRRGGTDQRSGCALCRHDDGGGRVERDDGTTRNRCRAGSQPDLVFRSRR